MYKKNISELKFENYLVKEVNFNINNRFENSEKLDLDIDFNQELEIDYEQKKAVIVLECNLFKDAISCNYPFELNISIMGFFEFSSEIGENEIIDMLEVNGTAILFPYLRSIITTITGSLGIQPIILPTMNIVKMIKDKKSKNSGENHVG